MPIHRSLAGTASMLVLLAFALTSHVRAQDSVFKSTVEVVPLTVTVTDARGKYVNNLVETDFTVLEEGVRQSLSFFANERVPIDLALTVDASASMAPQLPIVRKAAGALVDSLRERDRATVLTIRNAVGVTMPLTADRSRIDAAIRDLSASGATALYDGVYVVLNELKRARTSEIRRRVLVLLSDGLDTSSRLGADDMLALARRAGIGIYVIAMPTSSSNRPRKTAPSCRQRMRCGPWRTTPGPDPSFRRALGSCRPFTVKSHTSSRTSTSSGTSRHRRALDQASSA
jgi:VWFA-related protein